MPFSTYLYSHFSHFLAKLVTAIGLDPRNYSPHNFHRGGATFALQHARFQLNLLSFRVINVVHVFSLFRDVRQSNNKLLPRWHKTSNRCCLLNLALT